jgi:Ca-activated chloride channel family protein
MNEQTISPDDPKLTAYALGELSGEERAAVETLLKNDPAAQAAVEEIRALAAQLEGALAQEALMDPVVSSEASAGLAKEAKGGKALRTAARVEDDPYRKKVIRFPYVLIGSLAAACFAVVIVLQDQRREQAVAQSGAGEPATGSHVAASESAATPGAAGVLAEAETGHSLLLVKDAEEFAAIPAPSVAIVKTDVPAATREQSTAAPGDVFATAPEPVRAELSYQGTTPLLATSGKTEYSSLDADRARPVEKPAAVEAPAVITLAEHAPALARTTPAETAVGGSEDVIQLSAFTVSSSRDGGYAAASSMAGSRGIGSGAAGSGADKNDDGRGSTWGRTAERRDFYFDRPQLNFRAKSTVPARHLFNTEAYTFLPENDFFRVRNSPLSTFSIDVDTASYANVRRFLDQGMRPPRDAVRVEEMVNYFSYHYTAPTKDVAEPFAASMEIATAPWNPAHRLVRIGLKGREIATEDRPAANLVFLLDVSASMGAENKLPLVKESLRLLVEKLRADDRVAIVTYAGASGLALPSTPAKQKKEILAALDELSPGGSTNGAMGIQLAYDIAKANFIASGANRVILCTDGDFNVGTTSDGDLTRLIEEKAKSGVFLTVLGFGMGNFKDSTLERLADKGNGNYGYIDSRAEAQKLLVEQAGGTLVTIAKDVKLQVEFNPAVAQAYRLIGYENRVLKKEDFNNDKVDAGEIGAGHTVTALYEIVPVGAPAPESVAGEVDALKYQQTGTRPAANAAAGEVVAKNDSREHAGDATTGMSASGELTVEDIGLGRELLTLKIRFKEPTVDVSRKMEIPVVDTGAAFEAASKDFKFAAAVASLGMILRESAHTGAADYDRVISWAEAGKGDDADGRRGEFIELVKKARELLAE